MSNKKKRRASNQAKPATAVDTSNAPDKQEQTGKAMYAAYHEEMVKKQITNAAEFDKAILTLSSAALGLSLVFIKDIIPAGKSPNLILALHASWMLFSASVIATILSFMVSQKGLLVEDTKAYDYYVKKDEKAFARVNRYRTLTDTLNLAAGILFIFGLLCTGLFATFNL